MKSSIRIEFDFEKKEPVLQIKLDKSSDDLRDQMLSAFVEQINYSDKTIYGYYVPENDGANLHYYNITISENPPEFAVNQRVDHMRSWAQQFFQETEMDMFSAFFNALSVKASLKTINRPDVPIR